MKKILKHLLYLALALVMIEFALGGHGLSGWLTSYSEHVLAVLLAGSISALLYLAGLRTEVFILQNQQERTPDRLRRPLALFMRNKLKELDSIRTGLYSSDGLILPQQGLRQLVPACFDANGGRQYLGTDSSTPSEFYLRYPTYLEEHFEKKGKWRRLGFRLRAQDFRILLVTEDDLRADLRNERELFEAFIQGHSDHQIRLYQVEPDVAKKWADVHDLHSTDFGLFGVGFVVYFVPPSDDKLKSSESEPHTDASILQYRIFMEPLDKTNRARLRGYLKMLNDEAKEIFLNNDRVICKDRPDLDKKSDARQMHWITKSIGQKVKELEREADQ